jgi:hypothetical protein
VTHGTVRALELVQEEPDMAANGSALAANRLKPTNQYPVVETTLLELVQTVGELTEDDREVVTTVVELLRSGQVRLVGNFRGQRLAVS